MDDKLRLLMEDMSPVKRLSVTVICMDKSNCLKHIALSL